MAILGVEQQVVTPCLVFFQVAGEKIEDVSIYQIDEKTIDPILVITELEQYIDEGIKRMKAQGDVSALADIGKVISPMATIAKVGEFLMRLKGFA